MKTSDVRDLYALAQRMDRHVERTDTCWNWTAVVTQASRNARSRAMGYGKIAAIFTDGKMYHLMAHRVAYMLWYGDVPDGRAVLHRCHNPRCVRPDHLRLGTQKDNMDDRMAAGHYAWGESLYNSLLTVADVVRIREMVAQGKDYGSIALMYGVDRTLPYLIATGKAWSRAPGPIRTPDKRRRWHDIEAQVPLIRQLLREGLTAPEIMERTGVSRATVYNVKYGKSFSDVPDA